MSTSSNAKLSSLKDKIEAQEQERLKALAKEEAEKVEEPSKKSKSKKKK